MTRLYLKAMLVIVIVSLTAGCSMGVQSTATEDGNSIASTLTATRPARTSTHAVTSTATPTSTPTLTPTLTLTPRPTATFLPTLEAGAAKVLFLDLIKNNAGCQLPCWWGIEPGKTSLDETRSRLNTLSSISVVETYKENKGYVDLRLPQGGKTLELSLGYEGGENIVETLFLSVQMTQGSLDDRKMVFGDPFFIQTMQPYFISQILVSYGQPDDIRVATYADQPMGWFMPFGIVLFYTQHNFLIEYVSPMQPMPGGKIRGCPLESHLYLRLWEDQKYLSLNEVSSPEGELNFITHYRSLEEATGMSINEFYVAFKDGDKLCLETPADLWPMPGE